MDDVKYTAWEVQTSKKWSDIEDALNYIHIDFIDYDHQKLVEFTLRLNKVLDRSEQEFSMALIEETKNLLEDLYGYAKYHFDREEQFMEVYQLPNIESHQREHIRILKLLEESINDYKSGKVKLTKRLKEQVMDWLMKHINVVDFDFFSLDNWSKNLVNAQCWEDVRPIIHLIGINDIDSQHQKLTEIAIETMKAIDKGLEHDVIQKHFESLIEFAKHHFNYEEKFIQTYGIQDTSEHNRLHEYFIETIRTFSQKVQQNDFDFNEMKIWILSWWIQHINVADQKCFDYKNWAYRLIEEAEDLEEVSVVLRLTNIDFIDTDHLALMELALLLNQQIQSREKVSGEDLKLLETQIQVTFDNIIQLAANHFDREEKLMMQHDMHDYRSHRAEHTEILDKMNTMKENFMSGKLYLSSNVKIVILEWWIQHTNTTDYRTFVQNYSHKSEEGAI